jgi:hypothetical protein
MHHPTDHCTTHDELRKAAIALLARAQAKLIGWEESAACPPTALNAIGAAYNDTCDVFQTEDQLYGHDPTVNFDTDQQFMAHTLAVGAVCQSQCNPPLEPDRALWFAIQNLKCELDTPKAPGQIEVAEVVRA